MIILSSRKCRVRRGVLASPARTGTSVAAGTRAPGQGSAGSQVGAAQMTDRDCAVEWQRGRDGNARRNPSEG